MARSSAEGDDDGPRQEIRLLDSGELWVATDIESGVASQGETRTEALENLDEALALHRGETVDSIDSLEAEREVLRDLEIDPDEVEQAREDTDELPDFMR
jgi:predicted RNase H-like HicB family nuclease